MHNGRQDGAAAESRGLTSGQLLQRYRYRAHLTQAELAERAGYTANYIGKLERDQRQLPLAVIEAVAVALELSVAEREDLRAAPTRQGGVDASSAQRALAGREDEVALLQRHLVGMGPPALLFAGEPGIGKTRLLDEAATLAVDQGFVVISGRCQRRDEDPYDPLTDALAHSIRELPDPTRTLVVEDAPWLTLLLPELTPLADLRPPVPGGIDLPAEQRRRLLFAAVAGYLRRIAGRAGTLLLLDDLQWAGPDALDLLALLLTAPSAPPIRLIGAYRDSDTAPDAPLADLVADLARSALVQVQPLHPLPPSDAEALLSDLLLDEQRATLVPAIARRAGGVPLFLISYAEALRGQERLELPGLELPWTLAQVIRQWVMAVPEAVRELLGVAAVIGSVVSPSLLCRVTGFEEDVVLDGLEVAAAARLLDEDEDADFRFRHDLIRETIEGDLSVARRRLLHRRVGLVLEAEERGAVESLAFHFDRSDDDDKAVTYLERAGTEALLRYAHAAAADYFRRAIERSTRAGQRPDSASTHEQLGVALSMAARYDGAVAALERAVELYRIQEDDEGMQRAAGRLAETHFRRGTVPEAADHVAAVAEDEPLEQAGSGSRGTLALREGVFRLLAGRGSYTRLLTAGRSLARVGRATRNDHLLSMGERAEGAALIFQGQLTEGVAVLERALQRDLARGEDERVTELALLLSGPYIAIGALEPAQALSRRMLALAEARSDPVTAAAHSVLLGTALHMQGDWEAAHRSFQRGDALTATGDLSSIAVHVAVFRATCLIWEGAWKQARHDLDRTLQLARR
ncbi:MAG TPA: AAA family ATPase, partial [Chloroflexota bacterium]